MRPVGSRWHRDRPVPRLGAAEAHRDGFPRGADVLTKIADAAERITLDAGHLIVGAAN